MQASGVHVAGSIGIECCGRLRDRAEMLASELHDLMVTKLLRRAGGTRRHWRMAIGAVRVHDVGTHPHCNWSVAPSGSVQDVAEIERLLDELQLRHRIVYAD